MKPWWDKAPTPASVEIVIPAPSLEERLADLKYRLADREAAIDRIMVQRDKAIEEADASAKRELELGQELAELRTKLTAALAEVASWQCTTDVKSG